MSEYALGREGAVEIERERLALLAEVHDPLTARQLDAIGVADGWRCADLGAGAGAVTAMLARRVGRSGSVLATDLDTQLLDGMHSANVEVRRHDILRDALPGGAFDLVHARCLLMHVPGRLIALARMRDAVRPGGWIAILDTDFTTMDLAPTTPSWRRTFAAFCDATVATGWDNHYGARLRGGLEAIELLDVETESVQSTVAGGSPWAELFARTLERLHDRLLDVGASAEDLDSSRRMLRDPSTRYARPTSWLAQGRRPER